MTKLLFTLGVITSALAALWPFQMAVAAGRLRPFLPLFRPQMALQCEYFEFFLLTRRMGSILNSAYKMQHSK